VSKEVFLEGEQLSVWLITHHVLLIRCFSGISFQFQVKPKNVVVNDIGTVFRCFEKMIQCFLELCFPLEVVIGKNATASNKAISRIQFTYFEYL